ncbi:MAG TPA: M20/M25/M40 family metallo-hydrolase [Terriglobales bacterium]|nr:M20/M25/M40 family metallo-hydrolase [Terriglobales bacterium]
MKFIRLVLTLSFLLASSFAAAQIDDATRQLSHDIFKQLIEINTTDSVGNVTTAAEAMAQRLRDAGYPDQDIQVIGPNDRKKNMVARLHGTGAKKPVLLIGHLDVVEARRSDWTTDPFQFVEKDGYYYGRGTQDMKAADAILVTTMIRFKKEGYKPDRDIILALTADEEGGKSNGVAWLVKNHRDLIDAEFVLNPDAGGVYLQNGKPVMMEMDATEKLYSDFQLTAKNPGGHSSLPRPDNAIYEIADALVNLEKFKFPFELNNVTREYFQRMSQLESGQKAEDMKAILKNPPDQAAIDRLSTDPTNNSLLHTTCVATRLDGGHANNALPQTAHSNVNCRILPGHSIEETRQTLIKVFNDPKVTVNYVDDAGVVHTEIPDKKSVPPPPLIPEVMKPLEEATQQMWPGIPVIPAMATGASDAIYTSPAGLPTYGVSGIALEYNDIRAHGKDERLPVKSFYDGVAFYYQLLKRVTSPGL